MTIQEQNRIIAEFMGWDLKAWDMLDRLHVDEKNNYHNNWNQILAVVKKIQGLQIEDFPKKKPVMTALMDVEIESLYKEVLVFIQWYNTLKK